MNLQSEQFQENLDALVEKNGDNFAVLEEETRPCMVTVRKDQWDAMKSLLQRVIQFQPTQLKALGGLATRAELTDLLEQQKESAIYEMQESAKTMIDQCRTLTTKTENIELELQKQLLLDGKNREKFFTDLKKDFEDHLSFPLTKRQKNWNRLKLAALILYPLLSALALWLLLR